MDGLRLDQEIAPLVVASYDEARACEYLEMLADDQPLPNGVTLVPANEIINAVVTLNTGESSLAHLPIMMQERIYQDIQRKVNAQGRTVRSSGEAVLELADGRQVLYVAVRTAQLH